MKKILLIISVVIILALGYGAYFFLYATRQHSPLDNVTYSQNGLVMSVDYSRPYKKGRILFGSDEEALQPNDEYWRLGANAATKFTTNRQLSIEGNKLEPGSYTIYTIPGETAWKIGFNTDWDRWGLPPPDYEDDLFRIESTPLTTAELMEQFTVTFENSSEGTTIYLIASWGNTQIRIPMEEVN